MPEPSGDVTAAGASREETDDYDLLTFGEVAVRLQDEIRALASRIASLEAAGNETAELEQARARLSQLRDAVARNSRQPINDENFARFFGYEGKARRSTT